MEFVNWKVFLNCLYFRNATSITLHCNGHLRVIASSAGAFVLLRFVYTGFSVRSLSINVWCRPLYVNCICRISMGGYMHKRLLGVIWITWAAVCMFIWLVVGSCKSHLHFTKTSHVIVPLMLFTLCVILPKKLLECHKYFCTLYYMVYRGYVVFNKQKLELREWRIEQTTHLNANRIILASGYSIFIRYPLVIHRWLCCLP